MNRSVSVGVVVLIVAALAAVGVTPVAVAATAAEPTTAHYSSVETPIQLQSSDEFDTSQDYDQTTFEITVHENGSATWTFRHEHHFDTGNESEQQEAFEEFADEFESEETGLYERFTEQATDMTERADERSEREMEATDFERTATIDDRLGTRGVVEMSFTWTEFAAVDDDGTVTVGDVFEDIYIAENQAIVIETGEGLRFDRVEPADEAQYPRSNVEDSNSVRWSGEQQFFDGQPRAVLVPNESADEGSAVVGDAAWQLALGVLAVLVVGGGGAWYYRRSSDESSNPDDGTEPEPPAQSVAGSPPDEPAAATAPPPTPDDASEPEPIADDELLTDEDRVVKLIRENGGRMKQVNIVEETGWSKSKVSMLLSDMADEGTISKLRVGRENIISLEGYEPEATKSPFEE
ncbi:helix-turn-helix transcriptional regulator [Natronolimnohabitans innermongolicus]|uniref:Membrane protein n=1 Tax=Natronolimnohabitans innermongolicus JCM 12255 TaxID=1227499 RepID=L9WKG7_9EURY|nr:hypothetical protein [Natronolimnohabitans innermongolicus]ELY49975.1 membrane protein [Natronolimnohabitans innermongolicus JCM 12255]